MRRMSSLSGNGSGDDDDDIVVWDPSILDIDVEIVPPPDPHDTALATVYAMGAQGMIMIEGDDYFKWINLCGYIHGEYLANGGKTYEA